MRVAIVKYNAGNIRSVEYALNRLGIGSILTDDPEILQSADKVIFPGVGEASTTMRHLRDTGLDEVIKNLKQDVLGICLGMQLLCSYSEEGNVGCLGIFEERVKRFHPAKGMKVPHMGWNRLVDPTGNLFEAKLIEDYYYFVHSFYVEAGPDTSSIGEYIKPFSASLEKENFYATQFHPEKSGSAGEALLKRFLAI